MDTLFILAHMNSGVPSVTPHVHQTTPFIPQTTLGGVRVCVHAHVRIVHAMHGCTRAHMHEVCIAMFICKTHAYVPLGIVCVPTQTCIFGPAPSNVFVELYFNFFVLLFVFLYHPQPTLATPLVA